MAETNKKINMGLFGDDEIEEKMEEKEVIRHDVGNDEKAEDIKQNEEKNAEKKVVEIDVKVLNEMSKQPFKIREETNDFQRLEESIKILGIKNPLQLAKTKDGYRIIEGHRRLYIAKKLGFTTVPCLIQEEDIDRNNIQLVDGNTTHREKLLTSEMVRAYKMKYEALKNLGLLAEENKKQIAEESDKSIRTIERYLKLGNLIDDLLEYIDEYELNKQEGISRNVGLILADLNSESQKVIYKYIKENKIILTDKQANEIKNLDKITEQTIDKTLNKNKKIDKRKSLSIPYKKIEGFFSEEIKEEERVEIIVKALEEYFKKVL